MGPEAFTGSVASSHAFYKQVLSSYVLSLKDPDRKPLQDTPIVGAACLPCSVWQRGWGQY